MEAQQNFAAFVPGPQFDEFLHGILPDGTVDWPNCTAVQLLRRQEEKTPRGEMTRLEEAVEAIRTSHPGHSPRKYFCSKWRELLKKSGQFEIRKEKGSADERGITWYRSLGTSDIARFRTTPGSTESCRSTRLWHEQRQHANVEATGPRRQPIEMPGLMSFETGPGRRSASNQPPRKRSTASISPAGG
ncbi:OST-HTH/LOTUS domain-containing protein [Variovorax sp. LARHSF232]